MTDEFGRHELLDRASIIMNLVGELILEHDGLKEDERDLAGAAHEQLFRLYQLLGERNLAA